MKRIAGLLSGLFLFSLCGFAQSGVERRDGFIPLIWDADQGKLSFEITKFDQDILYFSEVAKGSGLRQCRARVGGRR